MEKYPIKVQIKNNYNKKEPKEIITPPPIITTTEEHNTPQKRSSFFGFFGNSKSAKNSESQDSSFNKKKEVKIYSFLAGLIVQVRKSLKESTSHCVICMARHSCNFNNEKTSCLFKAIVHVFICRIGTWS